jgi:pantoate--beta-alanine ligase
MQTIARAAAMQRRAIHLKSEGKSIALVPTMGALHEGHLSLLRQAKSLGDVLIASIFVNPTQFGPREDFKSYPRNLNADKKLLREAGVDLLFAPNRHEIYPEDFDTYVVPEQMSKHLEGVWRPGHFRGVATVVLKLFNLVQADVAVFGQKDLQQSVVIKQMVRDFNLPVRIVIAPTLRDAEGIALSSRNAYLGESARRRARVIPDALFSARKLIAAGERSAAKIRNYVKSRLVKEAEAAVDYVSVADADTLAELKKISGNVAISLACRIEGVRLIDNITLRVR